MPKHLLITGGAGFIASHVIDLVLSTTDWNITSLDRLDYSGDLNRLHEVVSMHPIIDQMRVNVVFHDLKAEINPSVSHAINKFGEPDLIFHLAAGSHVDRSITYPMQFVMDNVVGTVNLLEYARTLSHLERFIYFSTDEVFGPAPLGVNYKEYDRFNSSNPYAASKASAEELCVSYENTYKLPIVITHTMNVFAERQSPEKYIPMCIRKIRDGEEITVHSDVSLTKAGSRFYIHASDVADGLLYIVNILGVKSICTNDFGGAKCLKFNLVGKEEIDNLALAEMIAEVQNKPLIYKMTDFHSSRPGHDLRYALSGELMKSLGWEPSVSLKDRIKQVVDWSLINKRWLR